MCRRVVMMGSRTKLRATRWAKVAAARGSVSGPRPERQRTTLYCRRSRSSHGSPAATTRRGGLRQRPNTLHARQLTVDAPPPRRDERGDRPARAARLLGNSFHYRWNPQAYAGAGYGAVMAGKHGSVGGARPLHFVRLLRATGKRRRSGRRRKEASKEEKSLPDPARPGAGPGGLDPVEVFESIPEAMPLAFESGSTATARLRQRARLHGGSVVDAHAPDGQLQPSARSPPRGRRAGGAARLRRPW